MRQIKAVRGGVSRILEQNLIQRATIAGEMRGGWGGRLLQIKHLYFNLIEIFAHININNKNIKKMNYILKV